MNKSTSVGFNTILQGAEEESVHCVIGRHTLVPAVEQELLISAVIFFFFYLCSDF